MAPGQLMPLASTVKILIAIEFAKQASHHLINEDTRVPLIDPAKYYIPFTNGNAHPKWVLYKKKAGHIVNDSIRLIDIGRGMILFSSNANAEYLMDLLGLSDINSNLHLLHLSPHTPLYYFSSALFFYQNPKKVGEDRIAEAIRSMSPADYMRAANLIHLELKNDSNYKKKFRLSNLSMRMQKLWSDRLPASTTLEYTKLCSILNERKYFDKDTYRILSEELEAVMENPANQSWLDHAGMKGGSTAFGLTKALYATLKDGTRFAMTYFFDGLTLPENLKLQGWMNDFELKVLTSQDFRNQLHL